jgi:hypothetical protein
MTSAPPAPRLRRAADDAAPARVMAEMLRARGARCADPDLFALEWPEGADLTAANLRRAGAIGLDLPWFAHTFLAQSAWGAYLRAAAPARRAHRSAAASAARDLLATAPPRDWGPYLAAVDSARRAYRRAAAEALVAALALDPESPPEARP